MKKYIAAIFILMAASFAAADSVEPKHNVIVDNGVYSKTATEWKRSLQKVSTVDSTTYIMNQIGNRDSLHKNKKRDVVVWVPSTTDLTKDFTMVVWFHGHWGYVPSRTFEDRTLKQFVPLAGNNNFVLVIPEMPWSVHTSTPTKRNGYLWMKQGDFLRFIEQVKGVLTEHQVIKNMSNDHFYGPIGKIDYKIVGHSAGGSTIKRLGITGDLCKLNPSMVVWSDSSYGNWFRDAWNGCLKNTKIPVQVFVQRWGKPHIRTRDFLRSLKTQPETVKFEVMGRGWSHKLIGDNVVSLSNLLGGEKDATNK